MHTFYLQAIITASLGGILYGYDMGVISGALPLLSAYFNLSQPQEEMIVSLLYFGGGVGAASGGFLCDRFGRKFAILITDVMFAVGAYWLYSAATVESVMVGRFVMGWAVAVSGIADVAYLHEISSVWDEKEEEEEDGVLGGEVLEGNVNLRLGGGHARGVGSAVNNNNNTNEHEEQEMETKQQHGGGERGGVVSVNEACISLGFLLAYGVAFLIGDQSQEGQQQQTQQQRQLHRLQEQTQQDGDFSGDAFANSGTSMATEEAWRVMFAGGGILALLQFVGMLCMPESPVWLNEKGRREEARAVRQKIRGDIDIIPIGSGTRGLHSRIDREQPMGSTSQTGLEMMSSHQTSSSFAMEEQLHTEDKSSFFASCSLIGCLTCMKRKIHAAPSQLKSRYQTLLQEVLIPYKRQCIIAFFLATSQQFCGHPSILNFSPEIFTSLSHFSPSFANEDNVDESSGTANASHNNNNQFELEFSPIQLTVGIGVLKFLTTCIVILRVEKTGRRSLLLSGIICIAVSLSFLWIAFAKEGIIIGANDEGTEHYDADIEQHRRQTQQSEQQSSNNLLNNLAILGIYGVAGGYAASFGPLTWLLTSEIFPSSIRGRALGFATIVTYVAAGVVSRTFLSLQKEIGPAAPFAFYWISTVLSVAFVWFGVPDTGGGKGVDEINAELDRMWFWKRCGDSSSGLCFPSFSRKSRTVSGQWFFGTTTANSWTPLGNYGSDSTDYNGRNAVGISPSPSLDGDDENELTISTGLATHSETKSPSKSASPSRSTLMTRRISANKIESS